MKSNLISPNWPALPFAEWDTTRSTLHLWTQIVGKTRLALTPLENHWWNVTLRVTPRGLRTPPIPFRNQTFEVEFDFIAHQLLIRTSEGREKSLPLYPRSVADFYAEYMSCLKAMDIEVEIHRIPDEVADRTPFDEDRQHASYDPKPVENFRQILVNSATIFEEFRSRFIGKCSPVQFFWGSFDLAVTRFSGRRATLPPTADALTREAYSHEVISCGFWPGDQRFAHPAYYSYTAPAPAGLDKEPVRPNAGYWDSKLGEFILKYDDVRAAQVTAKESGQIANSGYDAAGQAILEFCESTYEAGAKLAKWDRANLER